MNSRNPTLRTARTLTFAAFACLLGAASLAQVITVGNQTVSLSALSPVAPAAVPLHGSFYSLHRRNLPPLPFLRAEYRELGLPVYWLGGTRYLVDDTALDWAAIEAQSLLNQAAAMGLGGMSWLPGEGGLTLMSRSYGTNDLWLELVAVTNQTAVLTIHSPVEDGVYDLFATTNLSARAPGLNFTNWLWLLRTNAGETTLTVPLLSDAACYFVLGTTNDTDADGLTDAFEQLVS